MAGTTSRAPHLTTSLLLGARSSCCLRVAEAEPEAGAHHGGTAVRAHVAPVQLGTPFALLRRRHPRLAGLEVRLRLRSPLLLISRLLSPFHLRLLNHETACRILCNQLALYGLCLSRKERHLAYNCGSQLRALCSRLVLIGYGIISSPNTVRAVSREGDRHVLPFSLRSSCCRHLNSHSLPPV